MAKTTCGESRRLSIFWFKKEGYLGGWRCRNISWNRNGQPSGNIDVQVDVDDPFPYVRLMFTFTDHAHDGKKEDVDYRIQLRTTPCHLGGKRYWFICPLIKNGIPCEKRVGILYGYGKWFGCRTCLDLAYQSQLENHSNSFFGIYGSYLRLEQTLAKKEKEIRVKYWRGRPTRRYARYLKRYGQLRITDPSAMERKLETLLGR